ncbi:MAG: DUF4854 domain-containing protein [Lachnospiraceae bacterium]|nr:DUF4854 domain-containing protein [Candidatus Merdinaster equi]
MKAMKKISVLALAVMMVIVGLCACGAKKTVESYYSDASVAATMKSQVDGLREAMSDYYSSIEYSVSGNTFVYEYTFTEEGESYYDADTTKSGLDAQKDTYLNSMKSETGVEDTITLVFKYYDSNNSLLDEFTYNN